MLELRETVASLASFIGSLPPAALHPSRWGPREVLAHLVYWHEHYVRIVRARLDGREPRLPGSSFVALNAVAVESLRGVTVAEMVRRLLSAQRKLKRVDGDARRARVHVRIKSGAKAWAWGEFVRRIEGHIRGHEQALRRSARSRDRGRSGADHLS